MSEASQKYRLCQRVNVLSYLVVHSLNEHAYVDVCIHGHYTMLRDVSEMFEYGAQITLDDK